MKRKFDEFLNDILTEIKIIKKATQNLSFEEFKNNQILIRAVTRSFEIIGEATNYISDDIKEKYKKIPWKDVKDFRNIIIHKYWGIELDKEWDIIQNELDKLEEQIQEVLEKENL